MQQFDLSQEVGYSGVLERGLAILQYLAECPEGATLGSLADQLHIPRSAMHRLLSTLTEQGFVYQQQERGTYCLTTKIQVMAFKQMTANGVIDALQPILNRLAQEAGELVRLAVGRDFQLTWVAKAQGAKSDLRYDPDMGMPVPLSCCATGFAWLSCLSHAEIRRWASEQGLSKREQFGPQAPETVEQLLTQLAEVRQRGYALAVQTFADWMSAMAMPIRHPRLGYPVGVISIAGPVFRLPQARLLALVPALQQAVSEAQQMMPGSTMLMDPDNTRQRVMQDRHVD